MAATGVLVGKESNAQVRFGGLTCFFFFQAEDGIRDADVTGVQTCALPIFEAPAARGSAPAERYRYRDGRGSVGIIASVTRAFCAQCDRVRLTADGQIRTCLFAETEYDLRTVLRSGADDEAVARCYQDAVARKQWGHRINEPDFVQPARGMSQIGG